MNWENKKDRIKIISFFGILLILLFILAFVLYVVPLKEETAAAEQEITNQERVLAGAERSTDENNQELPNGPEEDELLRQIRTAADTEEAAVTTITNETASASDNAFVYSVTVSASSYQNLYQFLTALDDIPRIANIESADVTKQSENSYTATISLRVFYNSGS